MINKLIDSSSVARGDWGCWGPERRQLSAAKKKAQRLAAEMQDTKLHLEEQMSRNNDLERKQRRWASTNFVTTLYSIYIHFISQQFLKIWQKMVSLQYL